MGTLALCFIVFARRVETMAGEHEEAEAQNRRVSGSSEAPVEDGLLEEFENTVDEGQSRLNRTWRALIITGLFGGIDVGLGIMAFLLVVNETGSQLLGGIAFGIGLFAMKLAHSELFTENFLIPFNAVMARRGTWIQLFRLWAVTLVTNLLGGWLFMWLVVSAFPDYLDDIVETSKGYFGGGFTLQNVSLAVLAGFTITLTTRMSQGASSDTAAALISFISGFLVVGNGMLHGALNSVIVFAAIHAGADISYCDWLIWFIWVIPFNMLGGILILTLPRMIRTWELFSNARQDPEMSGENAGKGHSGEA